MNSESLILNQFSDLSQFTDPDPFLLRKDPSILPKFTLLVFFSAFPKGTNRLLSEWQCFGEKEVITHFGELLDTASELMLILGDPKHHSNPKSRVYWGQVINCVLVKVHLTVVPVGPRTHPVVISPVPDSMMGKDILSCWQNSNIGSLACRVRVIVERKARWRPLELVST